MIQITEIFIYILESYEGIFLREFTFFCLSFAVIRMVLFGFWKIIR